MNIEFFFALLALAGFLIGFFYTRGRPSGFYLLYSVYVLPLMDLKLTPFDYGALKVFDIISIMALIMLPSLFFKAQKISNYYIGLVVVFTVTLLLGSIASDHTMRSLLSLFSILSPFIYAGFLMHEIAFNAGFSKSLFRGLKCSGYVALTFIVIQVIAGPQFSFYDILNQNVTGEGSIRYPGFFMDAQLNGIFLIMLSFFWLLNFRHFNKLTFNQLFLFALVNGGALLSGSRSPMLGLGLSVIFLMIVLRGELRSRLLTLSALGTIVLFSLAVGTNMLKRFNELDDAYSFRSNIWKGAFDIFKEYPYLGIGTNNYQDYVEKNAQEEMITYFNNETLYLDQPESGYLKLMTEWGVISFSILMFMIIAPLLHMIFRFMKGYDVKTAPLMAAPVICWFISFISLYTLSDRRIALLLCISLVMLSVLNTKQINGNEV